MSAEWIDRVFAILDSDDDLPKRCSEIRKGGDRRTAALYAICRNLDAQMGEGRSPLLFDLNEIKRCAAGVVATAHPTKVYDGVVREWWVALKNALQVAPEREPSEAAAECRACNGTGRRLLWVTPTHHDGYEPCPECRAARAAVVSHSQPQREEAPAVQTRTSLAGGDGQQESTTASHPPSENEATR